MTGTGHMSKFREVHESNDMICESDCVSASIKIDAVR